MRALVLALSVAALRTCAPAPAGFPSRANFARIPAIRASLMLRDARVADSAGRIATFEDFADGRKGLVLANAARCTFRHEGREENFRCNREPDGRAIRERTISEQLQAIPFCSAALRLESQADPLALIAMVPIVAIGFDTG